MAKRYHLDLADSHLAPVFIGIASRLRDYQLCYHINKKLGFELKKLPDFTFHHTDPGKPCSYSLYRFPNEELRTEYLFLSNHHPESKLLPVFKQTDYFLLAAGEVTANETERLILSLRGVPDILLAYYLDMSRVKQLDVLLTDLELHLMETEKGA